MPASLPCLMNLNPTAVLSLVLQTDSLRPVWHTSDALCCSWTRTNCSAGQKGAGRDWPVLQTHNTRLIHSSWMALHLLLWPRCILWVHLVTSDVLFRPCFPFWSFSGYTLPGNVGP